MKGTKYGPVVVAGDPLSSSLYRLVAGKVDPSIQMPHGKEALAPEEIVTIERWIEQGAKDKRIDNVRGRIEPLRLSGFFYCADCGNDRAKARLSRPNGGGAC